MIGVSCLRMNGGMGLQGNPNLKDVHDGSTFCFWSALSMHHFSTSKVVMDDANVLHISNQCNKSSMTMRPPTPKGKGVN
jgi:hypothetical protein